MDYELKIGDREITVAAEPLAPGAITTWQLGDAAHAVLLRGALPHGHGLSVDGRRLNVYTARTTEGTWVWCRGRARLVRDAERERRRSAAGPSAGGGGAVTPVTPGVVVAVEVSVGDAVDAGQGLVVLSAMKMESTLVAGYAGTISAVNTEIGAKVMPGDILVEIEPTGEEEQADE